MSKPFRNLIILNAILFAAGWYWWAVRFNLDLAPMWYASFVVILNGILAWWVSPRHKNAALFLLGGSSFVLLLNFILLRGIINLR